MKGLSPCLSKGRAQGPAHYASTALSMTAFFLNDIISLLVLSRDDD